jgi:MFS family permease
MAAADEAKSAELIGRLERLAFLRWHRSFSSWQFLGIMFDAADFALFGAALPPIAREFGLGPAQSGLLATVGLIGAFVGALFWGTISDYIGRRTSFRRHGQRCDRFGASPEAVLIVAAKCTATSSTLAPSKVAVLQSR